MAKSEKNLTVSEALGRATRYIARALGFNFDRKMQLVKESQEYSAATNQHVIRLVLYIDHPTPTQSGQVLFKDYYNAGKGQ